MVDAAGAVTGTKFAVAGTGAKGVWLAVAGIAVIAGSAVAEAGGLVAVTGLVAAFGLVAGV